MGLAVVAQRIEHLTTDQKVGGSNPSDRASAMSRDIPDGPNPQRGSDRCFFGVRMGVMVRRLVCLCRGICGRGWW